MELRLGSVSAPDDGLRRRVSALRRADAVAEAAPTPDPPALAVAPSSAESRETERRPIIMAGCTGTGGSGSTIGTDADVDGPTAVADAEDESPITLGVIVEPSCVSAVMPGELVVDGITAGVSDGPDPSTTLSRTSPRVTD